MARDDAGARARRAAQRRLARNLRAGRPTLPEHITRPVRQAQRRVQRERLLDSPEAMEQAIGDKGMDDVFPGSFFRNLHSYSAATVRFMASKMTDAQKRTALRVSAAQYQALASRQSTFNVYWYHHATQLDLERGYANR